jgi:hypothetical protein
MARRVPRRGSSWPFSQFMLPIWMPGNRALVRAGAERNWARAQRHDDPAGPIANQADALTVLFERNRSALCDITPEARRQTLAPSARPRNFSRQGSGMEGTSIIPTVTSVPCSAGMFDSTGAYGLSWAGHAPSEPGASWAGVRSHRADDEPAGRARCAEPGRLARALGQGVRLGGRSPPGRPASPARARDRVVRPPPRRPAADGGTRWGFELANNGS